MLTLRQLSKVLTPWFGLEKAFDPTPYAGFLYCITELSSGRQYIGKKVFWFNRRHKVKGRKNRRKVTSESDWRTYKGSSKEVLEGIRRQGIAAYDFRIISYHATRSQVNYAEVKELFKRDVLTELLPSGDYAYFNACVAGKWYRGKV